MEQVGFIRVSI